MRGHLCYVCEERLGFDDDDDDAIIFWGRCFLTYMITRKSAMIVVELGTTLPTDVHAIDS